MFMKTIVALLLAPAVTAFGVHKAMFGGVAGLARAHKYDPEIFEDASTAKDAFAIDEERSAPRPAGRMLQLRGPEPQTLEDCAVAWKEGAFMKHFNYEAYDAIVCIFEFLEKHAVLLEGLNHKVDELNHKVDESKPTPAPTSKPTPKGCTPEDAARCSNCKSGGSGDGGVPIVDGVCHHFCSGYLTGYCGVGAGYRPEAGGTDCTKCAVSSSGKSRSRTRTGSLSIILPVVVAAVLLVAAVLFLVRKRRVAAATPDEVPQIGAEVEAAVEAS